MTNFEKEFHDAKKRHYFARLEEYKQKMARGKKFLKEEQYLIKVEVEGCPFCGNDSLVEPEVFTKKVALEELPQYFKYLSEPFWQHQDVNWRTYTDEEFCDNIPYEEKKWGIYKSVQIIERIGGEN